MAFEGIICPHDGATTGITQVEPDTYYCSHHKGLFKYVDPQPLTVKLEDAFAACVHCGGGCGRKADYGKCARCGELHCERHYFTPDTQARVPASAPYLAWAISASGAGCESCLTEWAKKMESLLSELLDAVTRQPDKSALRSIAAHWPTAGDFSGRATRMIHSGIPPGWPLVEKFAAAAAPLIARVACMLPCAHDVVQVQAEIRWTQTKAAEIWRTPASILAGGMIITQRGDVFTQKEKTPNIWGRTPEKIPIGLPQSVLVQHGEQVRVGTFSSPTLTPADHQLFPLRSGKRLDSAEIVRLWPHVLTAMADALP